MCNCSQIEEKQQIYTVKDIATRWKVSEQTVYNLIYAAKIKAFPINPSNKTRKNLRVTHQSLSEYEAKPPTG